MSPRRRGPSRRGRRRRCRSRGRPARSSANEVTWPPPSPLGLSGSGATWPNCQLSGFHLCTPPMPRPHPEHAAAVLGQGEDVIVGEAGGVARVLAVVGEGAALGIEQVEAAARAHPQPPVRVLEERAHVVVGQAAGDRAGRGGSARSGRVARSSRFSPPPEVPDPERAHVVGEDGADPGVAEARGVGVARARWCVKPAAVRRSAGRARRRCPPRAGPWRRRGARRPGRRRGWPASAASCAKRCELRRWRGRGGARPASRVPIQSALPCGLIAQDADVPSRPASPGGRSRRWPGPSGRARRGWRSRGCPRRPPRRPRRSCRGGWRGRSASCRYTLKAVPS